MTEAAGIGLERAADVHWDIAVVGAGPAGAMAALGAAQRGLKTLLIDRAAFPRAKVCGCCLNGRALSALAAAGLGNLPESLGGVPLHTMRWKTAKREARLALGERSAALSRTALDSGLVQAAQEAGAVFLPATKAGPSDVHATHRTLRLRQGSGETEVSARVVIAADGLGGRCLGESEVSHTAQHSRIGAGASAPTGVHPLPPGEIHMLSARAGYLGMVVVEDGSLNLAAAIDPRFVKLHGDLGAAARALLSEAECERDWSWTRELAWRGTPALTRRAGSIALERALIVGDAAGYVEPFTGEGIAWALTGGAAVSALAAEGARAWSPSIETEWRRCHRQLILRRQRVCRAIATVLRHPLMTNAAIALLDLAPRLARPVMNHLNQPLSSRRLSVP